LGFRSFKLSTLSSSIVLPLEVNDMLTRVPHRSRTVIHFSSLGFGSSSSPLLLPL
jgi:hypothetical protein